jgi:hypothetical protein
MLPIRSIPSLESWLRKLIAREMNYLNNHRMLIAVVIRNKQMLYLHKLRSN